MVFCWMGSVIEVKLIQPIAIVKYTKSTITNLTAFVKLEPLASD